jgi:hypothetical protein
MKILCINDINQYNIKYNYIQHIATNQVWKIPSLVQQPSQPPSQMTSPSQLATMLLHLGIVPIPLVTKPTQDSSTKSSSPPPKNNVNSSPMSPHVLAHLWQSQQLTILYYVKFSMKNQGPMEF